MLKDLTWDLGEDDNIYTYVYRALGNQTGPDLGHVNRTATSKYESINIM